MEADAFTAAWSDVTARIARAAPRGGVTLVAVSKTHPPEAIRALAACGARAFGENYVQEALGKQAALADLARRRAAFRRMRALFDALASAHRGIDTLSMGMSDDFELAIAEGATMVRVGSALFGARSRDSGFGIRDAKEPHA